MTQVINHNLGYKIVYNPGYDFELGYKNKSEIIINLFLILLLMYVVHKRNCSSYALPTQVTKLIPG